MVDSSNINEFKFKNPSKFGKMGWLLLIPIIVFALPTIMLIGLAMLPTFAAYMSDGRREKYATLCVGGFNFAATIPYIFRLWSHGVGTVGLHTILGNVWMWLVIYVTAAVGWFVFGQFQALLPKFRNGIISVNSKPCKRANKNCSKNGAPTCSRQRMR